VAVVDTVGGVMGNVMGSLMALGADGVAGVWVDVLG